MKPDCSVLYFVIRLQRIDKERVTCWNLYTAVHGIKPFRIMFGVMPVEFAAITRHLLLDKSSEIIEKC